MSDSSADAAVIPREAATVMLVRDAAADEGTVLEVCLLRRHVNLAFMGGAYVFPGGAVDGRDRTEEAEVICAGRTSTNANALLGLDRGGLAFWVAALRECFEEAGVLFAYEAEAPGALIDPSIGIRLAVRRSARDGESDFLSMCRDESVRLAADQLHYFSHWITPESEPRRFDTRFFVAALPVGQEPIHDALEMTETVWVRPRDALAHAKDGELDIRLPTMMHLEAIGRFSSSAELLESARAAESMPSLLPHLRTGERGARILLPGDPSYDDAVADVVRPSC